MNPVMMCSAEPIKRRYATHRNGTFARRGLKPTATIIRSLRDHVIELADVGEEIILTAEIQKTFEGIRI
jgi:hypothetical protein